MVVTVALVDQAAVCPVVASEFEDSPLHRWGQIYIPSQRAELLGSPPNRVFDSLTRGKDAALLDADLPPQTQRNGTSKGQLQREYGTKT